MDSEFGSPGEIAIVVRWGFTEAFPCIVMGGTDTITSAGTPTGGTFTLSLRIPSPFGGSVVETTAPIAYNAAAATIQSALTDLPSVSAGEIVCTGGALPATVTVAYALGLAGLPPGSLSADDSGLTGGTNPEIEVVRGRQDVTGWTIILKVMTDYTADATEIFELTATLTDATNGKISFAITVAQWANLSTAIQALRYNCNRWVAVMTGGPSASEQYPLAQGTFDTEPVGIPA